MRYRPLASTGLPLSCVGLGAWLTFGGGIGRTMARNLVARAFDAGVNFFDNAETYANGAAEAVMGDVLADLRLSRDAFCVSSKVFFGAVDSPRPTQRGLSRKHIRDACDAALQRLKVDYLDLYFCHRADPDVPIGETVAAMDALIRQGKILYWGTSEWPASAIEEAIACAASTGSAPPVVEQPQYNLLHRKRVETEYAGLTGRRAIGLTIWSPLASGLLSGKYATQQAPADGSGRLERAEHGWLQHSRQRGVDEATDAAVAGLVELAREAAVRPAQLAIAWCLRRDAVTTVLLGATSVEQLEENLQAVDLADRIDPGLLERAAELFQTLAD